MKVKYRLARDESLSKLLVQIFVQNDVKLLMNVSWVK